MNNTNKNNRFTAVYPHLCSNNQTINIQPLNELPDYPSTSEEKVRIIHSLPCENHQRSSTNKVAVILAAGKGSRMGNSAPQKTLCPIQEKPALLHLIETCKHAGIDDFVFLVGYGYKYVMDAVPNDDICASFLFQDEALGTGHAARIAARYLHHQNYHGNITVLMGDKWISQQGIGKLLYTHQKYNASLTLTAGNKEDWEDSGRLWKDEKGNVKAIIERADIVKAQMIDDFLQWEKDPVPSQEFIKKQLNRWNRPNKIEKLLSQPLWDKLHDSDFIAKSDMQFQPVRFHFDKSDTTYTGNEVEAKCKQVNLSVYVFKADAYYDAMETLDNHNAQKEYYLTDAVQYLAENHLVCSAEMLNRFDIMGFNTPEELKTLEQRIMAPTVVESEM